jgi:hypothetical protein
MFVTCHRAPDIYAQVIFGRVFFPNQRECKGHRRYLCCAGPEQNKKPKECAELKTLVKLLARVCTPLTIVSGPIC